MICVNTGLYTNDTAERTYNVFILLETIYCHQSISKQYI